MERIKIRSGIKFLHLKGCNAQQIHDEIMTFYGNNSQSHDTFVKWKIFQTGQLSLTDDPRCGRPSLSDDATTVKKVGFFYAIRPKSNHPNYYE